MTLLQRCRKHAAEEDIPLRQLFHDVCRSSDTGTAVSFATVESPVYKRHRTATPTLPTDPRSCDATLFGSRFATTGQSPFHRGQVTLGDDDTAVVFASDDQLELLRTASVDSDILRCAGVISPAVHDLCPAHGMNTRFPFALHLHRGRRLHCTRQCFVQFTSWFCSSVTNNRRF